MKYVLLFCGTRELQQAWIDLTEEARSAQYAEVGRWFAENGARLGPGNQLQPPFTATTVRFQGKGEPIIHDGPFIEGNEVIGGYVEINVADLDEALRLAKTWPAGGIVEVRPVMEVDHYHLFHAIRGELLLELSEREQARASALRALQLTQNPAEQSLLARRLLDW